MEIAPGPSPPRRGVLAAWRHPRFRLVGGAICGFLAGAFLSSAMQTGALYNFPEERAQEAWGLTLWGEHWALRGLAALTSAVWGGFIGGVVARHHGGIIGGLSTLPGVVLWVTTAYLAWGCAGGGYETILGNTALSTVLPLALPMVGGFAGALGGAVGSSLGSHYDARPKTLLGVRWYHFAWILFAFNAIVLQTAWVLVYATGWLRASLSALNSFTGLIPGMFLFAVCATLVLTFTGVSRAYRILAGLDEVQGGERPAVAVLKFGCGFPLIAVLAQTLITLIHFSISRWFA